MIGLREDRISLQSQFGANGEGKKLGREREGKRVIKLSN